MFFDDMNPVDLDFCTGPSSGVDRPQVLTGLRRWQASGVNWPRVLTGLGRWLGSDQEVLVSEWYHPPIPTGRNDRGGGDIVGGGTVRGMEASGLSTPKSDNRRERWFQSHTPSTCRERPNSRRICAWGVGTQQYAPPLENHWDWDDPWEGHVWCDSNSHIE